MDRHGRGAPSPRERIRGSTDVPLESPMPRQAGEDRRIMATCRDQHKAVPDRVVKAQALQKVKERAERVENASYCEKP